MSDESTYLITLTDGIQLYKVALVIKNNQLTGDAAEYCLEPENKKQFEDLLPNHIKSMGAIVQVEEFITFVDARPK